MKKIPTVARSRVFITAAVLMAGYFLASAFVTAKVAIEFTTSLLIAVSVAVVASYLPFLWHSARRDDVSQSTHLVVGIAGAWAHTAVLITWLIIWREGGHPEGMVNNRFVAFWLFVGVCSGIAHLTAPRVLDDGHIPKHAWIIIGTVIGIGAFVAIAIMQRVIDPGWLAKWISR